MLNLLDPSDEAVRDAEIIAENIRNAVEFIVPDLERKKYTSVSIEAWKGREEKKVEEQPAPAEPADTEPVEVAVLFAAVVSYFPIYVPAIISP